MHRILFAFLYCLPLMVSAQSLPSIEEKTKGLKKYEGYMNYYWDESSGSVWLEISRLDSEILYINTLPSAIGSNDIGLDRGTINSSRVVKFSRTGRKILMIEPNFSYRAITTDKAEQRAVEQSFAKSTLWGFTISAETNEHYLVDATDFLLRDALRIGLSLENKKQGSYEFEKSRSAMYLPQCKNFPFNTELEATITLVNTKGGVGDYLQSVTPSSEAITVRMHYSFVQLPDSNYKPRIFDPRSSFINQAFFDYSAPVTEQIDKHFVTRHRLQKKDPTAARSEAIKPIIYYLDNGTPEPIRSALLEGGKWWNQAFEAAGYINAFQVKILPEDADPMDIRYNMINWVHRSTRGWSYGSFIDDPRTGEIIKGNVTLGSLRVRQDYLIATGLLAPFENGMPADNKMLTLALNRLKQLSAHEIGHTIGLLHNYSASIVNRSSVMDYPAPYVTLDAKGDIDISKAYTDGIGDWDKVSIEWGYQDFPKGTDEKAALDSIINSAFKKGLQYITDEDARPAGGLHPTAHLWDNGSNPVEELKNAMKVRAKALSQFGENNILKGKPLALLEDALVPIYLYHRFQVEAVTKIVGGMNYTYALRGDGQLITKALTKEEQVAALNAVLTTIDPSVLVLPEKIMKVIPPRPNGYDANRELFKKRTGLAFDALSPAETAADMPLSFLFNSERINRLVEHEVENGGLGLNEMINILVNATWKAPRRSGMESLIQMQTEQILLTYLLSSSVNEDASFISRAVIVKNIEDLKAFINLKKKNATDTFYKGHLLLALKRMEHPEKASPTMHVVIPPGSPIGSVGEDDF